MFVPVALRGSNLPEQETGGPRLQPETARLKGLIGMFAACNAATASGMLLLASPPSEIVAGVVIRFELPTR